MTPRCSNARTRARHGEGDRRTREASSALVRLGLRCNSRRMLKSFASKIREGRLIANSLIKPQEMLLYPNFTIISATDAARNSVTWFAHNRENTSLRVSVHGSASKPTSDIDPDPVETREWVE